MTDAELLDVIKQQGETIKQLDNIVFNLNARVDAYERLIGQTLYAALRDKPDVHDLFNAFQVRQAEIYSSPDAQSESEQLTYEVTSRILSFVGRSLIKDGLMKGNDG